LEISYNLKELLKSVGIYMILREMFKRNLKNTKKQQKSSKKREKIIKNYSFCPKSMIFLKFEVLNECLNCNLVLFGRK